MEGIAAFFETISRNELEKWFSPKAIRQIPLEKRAGWVDFIFEGGFDSCRRMMKSGTLPQRTDAWHVQTSVLHPSLRWASDLFFRCYFLDRDLKQRIGAHQHASRKRQFFPSSPPGRSTSRAGNSGAT